jgi:hypothetical protein
MRRAPPAAELLEDLLLMLVDYNTLILLLHLADIKVLKDALAR